MFGGFVVGGYFFLLSKIVLIGSGGVLWLYSKDFCFMVVLNHVNLKSV